MSDTKLDPRSLSSAVVREVFPPPPPLAGWVGFYWDSGFYDSEQGTNEDAGWYCSGKVHATREDALCELAGFRPFEGSALVEVGSALFGESASEGGKIECPNCRPFGEPGGCTYCPDHLPQYRQQPAPAVAMTPALETLIQTCESWVEDISNYDDDSQARPVQDAIAAARSQAAEAGKVRMPKVRGALNYFLTSLGDEHLAPGYPPLTRITERAKLTAALAELDAMEGRK